MLSGIALADSDGVLYPKLRLVLPRCASAMNLATLGAVALSDVELAHANGPAVDPEAQWLPDFDTTDRYPVLRHC